MRNCVVRTYSESWSNKTTDLATLLKQGWIVKGSTPFMNNGKTEFVEYILEKPKEGE